MHAQTTEQLTAKKCVPCEGGVEKYTQQDAERQLQSLRGWRLTNGGLRIRKEWIMRNFAAAIAFFDRVADIAENEGHHPDLHLEKYRNVAIELSTHAIGGLSENDFILAAKIDAIPADVKK